VSWWRNTEFSSSGKDKLADSTLAGYRYNAANICAVFGAVALVDLTAADVFRYLTTKGTVQANRDRALLSAAYSHARRIGAFPKGATAGERYADRSGANV